MIEFQKGERSKMEFEYKIEEDFSEISSFEDEEEVRESPAVFHVDQKKTFGRWKSREIAIENMRLAERLGRLKVKEAKLTGGHEGRKIVASSAINRKKMQTEIKRKNEILAKRIADAKSCVFKDFLKY